MNVSIFETGYVGMVLAEVGHHVVCVDIDKNKIAPLKQGIVPIYEPGLEPIVNACYEQGVLEFTTSAEFGARHGEIQFIAVVTPPDEDGSADLK